jgi:hypothetical protein
MALPPSIPTFTAARWVFMNIAAVVSSLLDVERASSLMLDIIASYSSPEFRNIYNLARAARGCRVLRVLSVELNLAVRLSLPSLGH